MSELIAGVGEHGSLLDDPIGRALRLGVRECGEALAKKVNFNEMRAAAEKAAKYRMRLVDLIDKAWDGLECADGGMWIA